MTEIKYPNITVSLVDQNGNAFNISGICSWVMKQADLPQTEINNFMTEATSGDYNHLLQTAMTWFNVE